MPRSPRISYKGAYHHVIVRGNRGQPIFKRLEDREYFLRILKNLKKEYQFELHALSMLTNHCHFQVKEVEKCLSDVMHKLGTKYTSFFNWSYGKSGHLFQGRYKNFIIEKERYFLRVNVYINLNHVRAGISEDVFYYRWGSVGCYTGMGTDPLLEELITTSPILEIFGFQKNMQNMSCVHNRYKKLLWEDYKKSEYFEPEKEAISQMFLGSEKFIESVKKKFKK